MPLYEYECTTCGHQKEVWQKFSDAPLSECEVCRGKVKKIISQSTFHLKGSGWYVTDYASKSGNSQGTTPKSESKASSAEAKETGSSSEKKSATDQSKKKDS